MTQPVQVAGSGDTRLLTPRTFRIRMERLLGYSVSERSIRRWVEEGRILGRRVGGRVLIPEDQIEVVLSNPV